MNEGRVAGDPEEISLAEYIQNKSLQIFVIEKSEKVIVLVGSPTSYV